MTGRRAELGEFVAIGVGLAFNAFGPGPEVGAQLVAVTGDVDSARKEDFAARIGLTREIRR